MAWSPDVIRFIGLCNHERVSTRRGGAYTRTSNFSYKNEETVSLHHESRNRNDFKKPGRLDCVNPSPVVKKKLSKRSRSDEENPSHEGPIEIEDTLPGHLKQLRRTLTLRTINSNIWGKKTVVGLHATPTERMKNSWTSWKLIRTIKNRKTCFVQYCC